MDLKNKAKEMFLSGTSLVDISKKIGKPAGTVRRWKSEGCWDGVINKKANNNPKGVRKKSERLKNIDKAKIVVEKLDKFTSELTEKQKLFVAHYANSSNARQAALNAGYSPVFSRVQVYTELLANVRVKEAIEQLRAEIYKEIIISGIEIVNKHIAIANSDITDYFDEFGKPKPLSEVDGRLIKRIKAARVNTETFDKNGTPKKIESKEIIEFEIEDRQKSLDFLSKYTGLEKMITIDEKDDDKSLQIEVSYV